MTVASTTRRKSYAGNGVTTEFDTSPVVFFESENLVVYVKDADGTITTLVEGTDYEVVIIVDAEPLGNGNVVLGTVDLGDGADPYGAPAVGQTLIILRELDITQETDLANNDASDAEVYEEALDRIVMLLQEQDERMDRSFMLADTDLSGASVTIPTPEASTLLGWNADGDALQNYAAADLDLALTTAFSLTLLDDTTAAEALTTLGVSAFIQTLLNDANAATAQATLGVYSTAQVYTQAEADALLALKAALASPTFTGTPAAPTATADTDTTQLATTAFVLAQAASQAEQETGTSTTKFVTAGRQQSHPSAAKGWVLVNTSAGVQASYNVTSVNDGGAGIVTANWGTDFSGTAYMPWGQGIFTPVGNSAGSQVTHINNSLAAGTTTFTTIKLDTFTAVDPNFWALAAFGDQ